MSLDLFSMSLDPRVKTIFGDLCFILPVQHVIRPVQHVIGPVQHVIGPPEGVLAWGCKLASELGNSSYYLNS
ncbi:hypothetical protein TNCV_129251 [Trichonephila clavipes]|nr:hypothetical protein TNCV_129251 [Trichonephila clavipes]